jgi:hypothetical protein
MVYEMAQMVINPGMESAFEHGVAEAVPLFQQARGRLTKARLAERRS